MRFRAWSNVSVGAGGWAVLLLVALSPVTVARGQLPCIQVVDAGDGLPVRGYALVVYPEGESLPVSTGFIRGEGPICPNIGDNGAADQAYRIVLQKDLYASLDTALAAAPSARGAADTIVLALRFIGERPPGRYGKDLVDAFSLDNPDRVLSGATVRTRRRAPLVSNNDSTVYRAGDYRDSTDVSLAEVIERVPGMSLGPRGELVYRGTTVSRVLVDGRDLFGVGGYREAIASLDAEFADELQAIERYHADAVLSDVEPSEETVVNLVSAEAARGQFVGQAPLALGASTAGEPRYDIGGTGTYIGAGEGLYVEAGAERTDGLLATDRFAIPGPGRPEPIGEAPAGLPSPIVPDVLPTAGGLPNSLIGDARRARAAASYHRQLAERSSLVARVSARRGRDELAGATTRSVENAGALDYRLAEASRGTLATDALEAAVEYEATAPDRRTTYRAVARANVDWLAQDGSLRIRRGAGNALADTFDVDGDGRGATAQLGVRINRKLTSSLSAQGYVEALGHARPSNARLDVVRDLELPPPIARPTDAPVEQAIDARLGRLRAGAKAFARVGATLLEARVEAQEDRFDSSVQLVRAGRDARFDQDIDLQYARQIAALAAGVPLARRWRARGEIDAARLAGPFAGGEDVVEGVGYDLRVERVRGATPVLSLVARRGFSLPQPSGLLDLTTVAEPALLVREATVARAELRDEVALSFQTNFPRGRGRLDGRGVYRYRTRELTETYALDTLARAATSGRPIDATGLSVSLRADYALPVQGIAFEAELTADRDRREANVEAAEGRLRADFLYATARVYWLRNRRLLPRLELQYTREDVTGALSARRDVFRADLLARVKGDNWSAAPTFAGLLVRVAGGGPKAQHGTAGYAALGLEAHWWPRGTKGDSDRQADSPSNPQRGRVSFYARNLLGVGEATVASYAVPFLIVTSVEAVAPSAWIAYTLPLGRTPRR